MNSEHPPTPRRRRARLAWGLLLAAASGASQAGLGQAEIPGQGLDGPVTVYYPTQAEDQPVHRGRLVLKLAPDAAPAAGNGRLVVISHGSGGSPWVHADLARSLTEAGFVVAMPEHRQDNYRDDSNPGPASWAQRPAEVSRAIDAVARDPRFAPRLRLDRVGVYGGSAGGHTALTLAGGRWSPAAFARHCEAHLVEDFQSCVGLITRLTGGWADGLKKWLALTVIGWRFTDDTPHSHHDPRVAAVVSQVPSASSFDPASLARPRVPLALVTSGQDRWLVPRWHSDPILAACSPCERLAELPDGGHGAMLSPLPPGLTGLLSDMLDDPPGFDRARVVPQVNRQITGFMLRHLGAAGPAVDAPPEGAVASRPAAPQ